jgi:Short C-terminal domain/Phospholipase_D-nuclease N-terminal
VIWIWLLITILIDVFRRHDISGWAKAGWTLFVIFLPLLGVLIYLITQSRGMAERGLREQQGSQAQFEDYVTSVAGSGGGAVAEIEKAKQLLDSGAITQAEFEAIKAKALG